MWGAIERLYLLCVQDDAGAIAAAEAILAHMEYALAHRLGDGPGRPEQLTVVLDSHGAPTLQVRPVEDWLVLARTSFPADCKAIFKWKSAMWTCQCMLGAVQLYVAPGMSRQPDPRVVCLPACNLCAAHCPDSK